MKTCSKCKKVNLSNNPYCNKCWTDYIRQYFFLNNRHFDTNKNRNPKKFNEYMKNYFKNPRNRQLKNIRNKVQYAVRIGKISKPKLCQYPNCTKAKLEMHHENYQKPLFVKWFCKHHHKYADMVHRLMPKSYQLK